MENPSVGKTSILNKNKKLLNNSNPDLPSIMAHSNHIQVKINLKLVKLTFFLTYSLLKVLPLRIF